MGESEGSRRGAASIHQRVQGKYHPPRTIRLYTKAESFLKTKSENFLIKTLKSKLLDKNFRFKNFKDGASRKMTSFNCDHQSRDGHSQAKLFTSCLKFHQTDYYP